MIRCPRESVMMNMILMINLINADDDDVFDSNDEEDVVMCYDNDADDGQGKGDDEHDTEDEHGKG